MKTFFAAFVLISAIIYLYGCGDDNTTGTGGYQYTVVDSLFFQKDYDSLSGYNRIISQGYVRFDIKKFRITCNLYTNDFTDSVTTFIFKVFGKNAQNMNYNGGFTKNGNECNGYVNFEYEFPSKLDSIQVPYYPNSGKINTPDSIYIIVRNLKVYTSY